MDQCKLGGCLRIKMMNVCSAYTTNDEEEDTLCCLFRAGERESERAGEREGGTGGKNQTGLARSIISSC